MRKLVSTLALAVLLLPAAHASDLSLTLNDDMAQFVGTKTGEDWGMRDAELGFGILFNDNDDIIGTLRLLSTNRVSQALRFGVGLQGYGGHLENIDETVGSVAIGGNIGLGLAAQIPLTLVLEGWIAPNILSFGDIEGTKEWSARIEAGVTRRAAVFVGYRKLEMEIEGGGDYELDDSANIGVRLGF